MQPSLYSDFEEQIVTKTDNASTFLHNLKLPIHRWFRYSAGFSAEWVRKLLAQQKAEGRRTVLDPFAGCGTVLLEAESAGIPALGIEAHPFVSRVARTKLLWRQESCLFRDYALSVLHRARKISDLSGFSCPPLIHKCFPPEAISRLYSLYKAWHSVADDSPFSELTWLVLISILRECSPVGTAQWQYVLPNKSKANFSDPYKAFEHKVYLVAADMALRQGFNHGPQAALHCEDARECASVPDHWADLVITSPPYANNYDYADATRLEMTFLGDVQGWGHLQDVVRKYLIRSCTQHVAKMHGATFEMLTDPVLDPIRRELVAVCKKLEAEKENHGGKKPYHTMMTTYFIDMAKVWIALRRATSKGAQLCFVIGDSAPYGIYVPVHIWLGRLAIAAGFESFHFNKLRDRNVKWKNRKHRVPLSEGYLWIKG